jgi:uncharacterized LabA/DUF88 family protein
VTRPTASIYVDGLNLYRQKLEFHADTKWLDLIKLSELLLPTHDIVRVRYFAAKVKPAVNDPNMPVRQMVYWRALRTLGSRLSIHEGQMRADRRRMLAIPRSFNPDGSPVLHKVLKIEEKGSDVSLASHMILDAATRPSDIHVLVSSDSDFVPPLSILRNDLGVATGLFSPIDKPSTSLLDTKPLIVKTIRTSNLLAAQFAHQLNDEVGVITRPESWT